MGSGRGKICRCGHPRSSHEHYRPGSDCAECGKAGCTRYRPHRFWHRTTGPQDRSAAAAGGETLGAQPVYLWEVERRKRIRPEGPGEEKIG